MAPHIRASARTVQIAKSLGAHVTGVSRTDSLELVRSIGVDEAVDSTRSGRSSRNS